MKLLIKLILITFLWLAVINPGTYIGLDTALRLQMTHSWWQGQEEVLVSSETQPKRRGDIRFGVQGRDNKRYIAYDVGQSLLMLPGDWVGTQLGRLFPSIGETVFRNLAVQFLVFIPLNVAAIIACFWLLRLFQFKQHVAALSSIGWLLSSTVLHYAQIPQQNNQILLFVTIGYASALAGVRFNKLSYVFLSGLSLGLAMLIRTTSIFHALTVFLFLSGCVLYQKRHLPNLFRFSAVWILGLIPFTLLGRFVDYLRYGSLWATSNSEILKQLGTDPMWSGLPQLPANYPFVNPPWIGILDTLFSPARSIFIYDPLFLPCLILTIVIWKKIAPYVQLYLLTGLLNLALHILLTSKLVWTGGTAWGARFHVTSVHLLLIPLLALLVQLLLSSRQLKRYLIQGVLVIAIMTQFASVLMQPNLEIYQKKVGFPGTRFDFRLMQRVANIACLVDDSIYKGCIGQNPEKRQYVDNLDHIFMSPFVLSHQATDDNNVALSKLSSIVFVLWLLALVTAIGLTFCSGWLYEI